MTISKAGAEFRGLSDVDGGIIEGVYFFDSVADVVRNIRKTKAMICGKDNGAITVYINDAGRYRASREVLLALKDDVEVGTLRELAAWIKIQLPKIQHGATCA